MGTESQERIAYLGPTGTFSETAARSLASAAAEFNPVNGIPAVFARVAGGSVSAGVVPILNSRVGVIAETAAQFLENDDVFAVRCMRLRVVFSLYVKKGGLSQLQGVASHSAALAQCSRYLASRKLKAKAVTSTAEALRLLARGELPANWGAIAGPEKGEEYGLRLLAADIQDEQDAWTVFVRVERGAASELIKPGRSLLIIAQGAANKIQAWMKGLQLNAMPRYCAVTYDSSWLVEIPAATVDTIERVTVQGAPQAGVRVRAIGSLAEALLT